MYLTLGLSGEGPGQFSAGYRLCREESYHLHRLDQAVGSAPLTVFSQAGFLSKLWSSIENEGKLVVGEHLYMGPQLQGYSTRNLFQTCNSCA